ncbi:hypothetical protein [Microcoleus sp. S1D4]|uniref:hypothetical protein n=1 Tax=unclassified Microcoleus TaxID=2642155 RepID=UPI003FA5757B
MVIGYWLLVIGYWLLVIGYWLLVNSYWLLVIGYWLLVMRLKKQFRLNYSLKESRKILSSGLCFTISIINY